MPQWGIDNSETPGRAAMARPGAPALLELVLEGHADDLGPVVFLVDAEEDRGPGHAGPQERRESIRLPVLLGERLVVGVRAVEEELELLGMIVAFMDPWKVSTVSVLSEIQSRDGSSGFRTELRCFWKLDSCT